MKRFKPGDKVKRITGTQRLHVTRVARNPDGVWLAFCRTDETVEESNSYRVARNWVAMKDLEPWPSA